MSAPYPVSTQTSYKSHKSELIVLRGKWYILSSISHTTSYPRTLSLMYFARFLLLSLAIAMAAAAPMADGDDSGDITTARFLEDPADMGQVQTKRRPLGRYESPYIVRQWPFQEVCNLWLHIECVVVTTGRKIVEKLTTCKHYVKCTRGIEFSRHRKINFFHFGAESSILFLYFRWLKRKTT